MLRLSPPDKEKISQSEVVESILPLVDALFVSEETLRRMLQRTGPLDEMVR